MALNRIAKYALCAVAALASVGLSGCGFDGVEFNGKVFDAMGLNSTEREAEPKMAVRHALVVPPGLEAGLPTPGETSTGQPSLAEIHDPDEKKVTSQKELQRQQQEYCSKNYDANRAASDPTMDTVKGPLGPCRASVFTAIEKWNKADDSAE